MMNFGSLRDQLVEAARNQQRQRDREVRQLNGEYDNEDYNPEDDGGDDQNMRPEGMDEMDEFDGQ